MTAEPVRVALLARTGLACDRLRAAIDQAGAQCVLQADPTTLEPSALVEAAPKVVLVALDPQAEDVLERFDEVLFDPEIEVIYEEAALAATREGWDVARWQRHLVAKLQQHGDVLPPGGEPEDIDEEAEPADAIAFGAFDADPAFSGAYVDADADVAVSRNHSAVHAAPVGDGLAGEAPATGEPASAPETVLETTRFETAPAMFHPFDPVFAEAVDEPSMVEAAFEEAPLMTLEVQFEAVEMDVASPSEALVSDAGNAWSLDADETDTDIDTDIDFDGGSDPDAGHDGTIGMHGGAPEPEAASLSRGFGELSLDDGSAPVATQDNDEAKSRFQRDISDLEVRISGLTLVDDTPVQGPEQARGAVLVLAGLGGPDAVRQLLGALPEGFTRPVLVQQRLDGGRYDKLVAQMQRATSLPVRLAEPGGFAHAGIVYILPAAVGVDVSDTGIRFNQDGELLAALPSGDSAVLLLSGSDAGQVDAALNHGWAGALVAGQVADGCYDAAAPNALAARGGDTGTPVELAQRLAERWPS